MRPQVFGSSIPLQCHLPCLRAAVGGRFCLPVALVGSALIAAFRSTGLDFIRQGRGPSTPRTDLPISCLSSVDSYKRLRLSSDKPTPFATWTRLLDIGRRSRAVKISGEEVGDWEWTRCGRSPQDRR